MSEYFLHKDVGSDLNSGLSESPVQSLERISNQEFNPGDVVHIQAGTEADPVRGELRPSSAGSAANKLVFRGNCSLASSYNLTEGAEFPIIDQHFADRAATFKNLWFQSFTGGVVDAWSRLDNTAGIVENLTDAVSGMARCLELDSSGGNNYIRQTVYWSNIPTKLRLMYKTDATGDLRIDVRAEGDGQYANLDSAGNFNGFAAGLTRPALPVSLDWIDWETDFITRPFGSEKPGRIQIFSYSGGKVYLQRVSLIAKASWTEHDAVNNVHKLELPVFENTPHVIAYCTKDQWETDSWSALSYMLEADSLAEIQAGTQANRCYLHTDGSLYIQLPANVNLADLHIECMCGAQSVAYISTDHVVLAGSLKLHGGRSNGLNGVSIYETDGVISTYNRGYGARDTGAGASATHKNPEFSYNGLWQYDDFSYPAPVPANGYLSSDSANAVITGGRAIANVDDGFQNDDGGTLELYGCLAHSNESEQVSVSGGDFVARCCTFAPGSKVHNLGHVICNDRSDLATNDASYTRSFVDCYITSEGVNASAFRSGKDDAGNLAASGNIVIGGITDNTTLQTFANQTGLSVSDPGGLEPDFVPAKNSVAIGGGVKWWSEVARPVSANGEPYPDVKLDIGGLQSTHSQTHPRNL